MARVDWITWKTDVKELINLDKVKMNLDNNTNDINHVIDDVFNNIKIEIEKGGLNRDALSLNGDSPNNISGNKVLNRVEEVRISIDKLKNKILSQAEEQKKCEKEQLIKAIEEKISEQEKILESTKALKEKIIASSNNLSSKEVDDIINNTTENIEILKVRLEKAKAL